MSVSQTGRVSILHTWGQALTYHPHVHLLVSAGDFDNDQIEWIQSGKKIFIPVKALSSLFRGIFADNIYKYAGELIPGNNSEIIDIGFLRNLIYKTSLNVFSRTALNNTHLSLSDKEMEISSMEGKNWQELVQDIFGYDPFLCKKCKKGMMLWQSDIDAKQGAA